MGERPKQTETKYKAIVTEYSQPDKSIIPVILLGLDKNFDLEEDELLWPVRVYEQFPKQGEASYDFLLNYMEKTQKGNGILEDAPTVMHQNSENSNFVPFSGLYWFILSDFLFQVYKATYYDLASLLVTNGFYDSTTDNPTKKPYDMLSKAKFSQGKMNIKNYNCLRYICFRYGITDSFLSTGTGYFYPPEIPIPLNDDYSIAEISHKSKTPYSFEKGFNKQIQNNEKIDLVTEISKSTGEPIDSVRARGIPIYSYYEDCILDPVIIKTIGKHKKDNEPSA